MRLERWILIIPLRLRSLFRREDVDRELDEELAFHLDQRTQEFVSRGLDPKEARRLANLAMEGVTRRAEECRDTRGWSFVESWQQDLRQAIRSFRLRPGTALTVVSTIALAIGATTAVYSVVESVLLRPLPYPEPERLARIWQTSGKRLARTGSDLMDPKAPVLFEWLKADTGFESLGAYVDSSYVLRANAGAEVIRGQEATSGVFEALGVLPILGRRLAPADNAGGGSAVVVLSEGFWRNRFGGNEQVVGTQLVLDGRPHVVVGVMPTRFSVQTSESQSLMLPGGPPQLWTPLSREVRVGNRNAFVIGRVKKGVTIAAAAERLSTVHAGIVESGFNDARDTGVKVRSLLDSAVGDIRATMWFLLVSVALVLVVAAVNIANILTALGLKRQRELAVRAALGASRSRLVRSVFVESALLAVVGGVGGIALAWAGLPVLVRLLPPTLPRLDSVAVSVGVLACGLGLTITTALLVGPLPAMLAARTDPQDAMRSSGRSTTSGRAANRVRATLAVAEVALAFVLLTGAGLLGGSYWRLMSVERGFETQGLAAMWVKPTRDTYRNRDQFSEAMRARLEQIPGVRATAMNHLPLSGLSAGTNFYLDRGGEDEQINAILSIGQDNYFDVMGVPIVAGRGFKPGDTRNAPRIAVVNQTLARRCWPDGNAIGQRFRTGDDPKAWVEVVGIAGDIRHKELAAPIEPTVHLPATQAEREINEWVLRFRGNPAQVLQRAREVVAGVSPLPVSRTLILEDAIGLSVAIPRFRTYFIVGLAGLAAVLALLGMYGVLAFSVAQRTREIGVRMALGAQAGEVVRAVIGSGMKLALVGAGIGLAVAWSGAGLLSAFLFDVAPRHVATYAGAVAGVLVISYVAAYLPARRAAGVNPVSALKDE